jgi:hypothetical protein
MNTDLSLLNLPDDFPIPVEHRRVCVVVGLHPSQKSNDPLNPPLSSPHWKELNAIIRPMGYEIDSKLLPMIGSGAKDRAFVGEWSRSFALLTVSDITKEVLKLPRTEWPFPWFLAFSVDPPETGKEPILTGYFKILAEIWPSTEPGVR